MKSKLLVVFTLLALLVTACGSPQTAAPTTAPATEPATVEATLAPTIEATMEATAAVPVTGGASVAVASSASLGPILVDDKGMTLYLFTKDTPGTSNCYDKCATNWPALLTSGAPVAGEGVDAALLGTTQRTDGTIQVTYNGWPLYYYIKDKQSGDTIGQEVGDVWFVLTPSGNAGPEAGAAPAAPAATDPAPTMPPSPY